MSTRDPIHDECSMGDLIVRAVQRGGDRVAFTLDEHSLTYRAFFALPTCLSSIPLRVWRYREKERPRGARSSW